MNRVVLFDLDGTLWDAGRSGRRAFTEALRFLRPDLDLEKTSFAGKTDLGILSSVAGKTEARQLLHEMKSIYPSLLWSALHSEPQVKLLPGVVRLLQTIEKYNEILPIVQTGNIREGAHLKLRFFGLSGFFPHIASGENCTDRKGLLLHAMELARKAAISSGADSSFVLIGDTKEEQQEGRSLGMRTIGVETGVKGIDVHRGNPDFCFSDLSDTEKILEAIFHARV